MAFGDHLSWPFFAGMAWLVGSGSDTELIKEQFEIPSVSLQDTLSDKEISKS